MENLSLQVSCITFSLFFFSSISVKLVPITLWQKSSQSQLGFLGQHLPMMTMDDQDGLIVLRHNLSVTRRGVAIKWRIQEKCGLQVILERSEASNCPGRGIGVALSI